MIYYNVLLQSWLKNIYWIWILSLKTKLSIKPSLPFGVTKSLKLWSVFDAKRHFTEEEKQEVFRQVATKVQWLEGNKEAVLQFLLKNEEVRELFEVAQEDLEEEVSDEQFCEAVYFYDLYCEVGEDLVCTFDVDTDPDYFLGHLVNIRLDDNYQLHLETISG